MYACYIDKKADREILPPLPSLYSTDRACNYPTKLNVEDPCGLKSLFLHSRVKLWELLSADTLWHKLNKFIVVKTSSDNSFTFILRLSFIFKLVFRFTPVVLDKDTSYHKDMNRCKLII